jgi:hypothetical protein
METGFVIIGKLARLLRDAARANIRLLRDPAFRDHLRSGLGSTMSTAAERDLAARELVRAPGAARSFAGLTRTSTALAGVEVRPGGGAVNLVIGQANPSSTFAGIHTAILAAAALARHRGTHVRVVTTDFSGSGFSRTSAEAELRKRFDLPELALVTRETLGGAVFGEEDIWLASHWLTAHALQVASEVGTLSAARVAYLIQDYEPGFSPWSSDFVAARATYHAGFLPIANSIPVAEFVRAAEGVDIAHELVFAPTFELDRLRMAAATAPTRGPVRVLFYSRPSKARNLYRLGIAALREAARELDRLGSATEFYSAGESHPPVTLFNSVGLTSLGKLGWADYFEFLGTTHVLVSLQYSPHPSHPPFDAAIAGGRTVTNEFHGTRSKLHPRIDAVGATVAELAAAIVNAVSATDTTATREFTPLEDGALGRPLSTVMEEASRRIDARLD